MHVLTAFAYLVEASTPRSAGRLGAGHSLPIDPKILRLNGHLSRALHNIGRTLRYSCLSAASGRKE